MCSSAGKRATSLSAHLSGLGDNRSHSHGGVCNELLSPVAPESYTLPRVGSTSWMQSFHHSSQLASYKPYMLGKRSRPKASRTCFLASECPYSNWITLHCTNTQASTDAYMGNTGECQSTECTYSCDSLCANKISLPRSESETGKWPDSVSIKFA